MKITILQDGRYNNADRTAIECKAGDVFETSQAYGTLLITDGLAEYFVDPDAVEPEAEPKKKSKKTVKEAKGAPASGKSNPFIS